MKNKKVKIAITGGIGSGKSTVARYFKEKGFPVFSCDEIYKEIYKTSEYQLVLAETFPDCIKNGKIDKQLLSQMVFSTPEALQTLNKLAHTRIMSTLYQRMSDAETQVVFAEVPLLFEGGYENAFDQVIVVLRDEAQRIKAVSLRDNITKEAVKSRMKSQFDYNNFENIQTLKKRGYIFVKNDFDEVCLRERLEEFLSKEIRK